MNNWIAVVCATHVARGREGGFMQVCHGKAGPLKRIQPGDRVVYYSPATEMGGKDKLQSFTAIGMVRAGEPYPFDMGGGFIPYRKDVDWWPAQQAAIQPLLEPLEFSKGVRQWGAPFRFGLFAISAHDMQIIANAMGVNIGAPPPLLSSGPNQTVFPF
ncbi:EVE domain-containing protein [Iodobacter sp. LRB]|uniref:EVE domain-containing protein n=1 Tax=unclassified Iodobacter TaxID=235634 RepID=UPI000C115E87|nr:EVE domain-containing protein [Iodobacter sp. BJB302]PHV01437.1 EVE domain-containing protein [Iodobacter sp. BJB302]